MRVTRNIAWLFAISGIVALPRQEGSHEFVVQRPELAPRDDNPIYSESNERAEAVKDAFKFAWTNYYKNAFPNDQLNPVSNTVANPRNGWGASAVDALSTAIIMDIPDIVNQVLKYIPDIDFSVSKDDASVSLFETTIRYLGGMISAYDFLSGPLADLADDKDNVDALLEQSQNLAGYLSYAFNTPSGVPSNNLFFGNRSTDGSKSNGLATIGTLVLEWTRLSDLTGNKTYAELSQRGESYLLNPEPSSSEPWPGLVGSEINITNGRFLDASGGWQGGVDSFYEYLIKMYIYDQSRFGEYKDRWVSAAESSVAHLASHPSSRPDLTYLAEYEGTKTINESEHLACFDGGNFILGGLVLGREDLTNFGLDFTAACHNTYTSTATRIGPEVFSWNISSLPENQTDFYQKNGFWIDSAGYDLRPEVIESYYYAYRATKDKKYQDWAWDAFLAINSTARVGLGFTKISDVNAPGGGEKQDNQESFLFAEVLKYSYLIQAEEQPWDVDYNGKNQWVYNTEAHPFKVAGIPI
ncbi:MAG: maturation of Asn-linked oligosaccharides protein [Alyxoria varia]|nr:MAG: maturation of Asn-linked oligosaccharides protein [Alyxoria varia]